MRQVDLLFLTLVVVAMLYSSGSCDDLPEYARPDGYLAPLTATPTEWVTVLGKPIEDRFDWGISSYLTPPAARAHALQEYTWSQAAIGAAGISTFYPEDRTVFEEGLRDEEEHAEFFVQLRTHHGLAEPTLEFTPSFLWYFDAIPRNDGSWYYLDDVGRDHELVRTRRTDTELRIDIAALPLRRYLAARSRLLVIQHDRITRLDRVPDPAINAVDRSDVRHFAFHSGDLHSVDRPGFVRLVGKQIVLPIEAEPADLARPHTSERRFPEFTVAIDPNTGERITSTCEPDKLSNYFTDRGTPHYLTRVYFRRQVLNRYTSQPSRYRIENGRLSCLGFWGISIGTNPDGLIEVYLGDLGRDLPAEERDHWLSFNVPPSGGRDEGRFDRDILGRWTDGPMDRWTDGPMDRWTDGPMDRWTDGPMDRPTRYAGCLPHESTSAPPWARSWDKRSTSQAPRRPDRLRGPAHAHQQRAARSRYPRTAARQRRNRLPERQGPPAPSRSDRLQGAEHQLLGSMGLLQRR